MTVYGTSGVLPLRTWLDKLHSSLLLGDLGRNYSELAASWLWVAALGGVALWLATRPKRKLKRVKGASPLTAIGISRWAALLAGLLFFSATGLTWSQWAGGNIDAGQPGLADAAGQHQPAGRCAADAGRSARRAPRDDAGHEDGTCRAEQCAERRLGSGARCARRDRRRQVELRQPKGEGKA